MKALQLRISNVNDLLLKECDYRNRVDQIQGQIKHMINENTEGRCVLEKALDMLDDEHTEEGNFMSNRIEENFQSRRSSSNSEAGWANSSSYSVDQQAVKRGSSYYSQQARDELP